MVEGEEDQERGNFGLSGLSGSRERREKIGDK